MNMRKTLLAGAAVMLLAAGPTLAGGNNNNNNGNNGQNGCQGTCGQAPEIDAASGTSAIALLTGIVLLMKERTRSKRSSKSDE